MNVFSPKDARRTEQLFYHFVDFLIGMINKNQVRIAAPILSGRDPCRFEIWLVESEESNKRLYIAFAYEPWKGAFIGTAQPIKSFRFELCQGIVSVCHIESSCTDDYDKMLALFKAAVGYLERNNPGHYKEILKRVDIAALERKNWKISLREIEEKVAEDSDLKRAVEDLDRKRKETLQKTTSYYRNLGYEITD